MEETEDLTENEMEEFFTDESITESTCRKEAEIIHSYLQGNLSTETTVDRVVQSLQVATQASHTGEGPSKIGVDVLRDLVYRVIVDAAETVPSTQDQLSALLMSLFQRPELSHLNEFDTLNSALRERWLRYGDPDASCSSRDDARDCWFNLNHFAAKLYGMGWTASDLQGFGESTLVMSLRRGGWRVHWGWPQVTSDDVIAMEGHLPAAIHWIMHGGRRLFSESGEAAEKRQEWEGNLARMLEQPQLNEDVKARGREALEELLQIPA